MKINCIICKKIIENPTMVRVTCGSEKCIKKYQSFLIKGYNRKKYIERKLK